VAVLITVVHYISYLLILIIFVDVLLRFFLNPFHPVRRTLDSIVEPMLHPIRNFMPKTGMLDFSPVVLILLIRFFELAIIWLLGFIL
jgi:YggT family protein